MFIVLKSVGWADASKQKITFAALYMADQSGRAISNFDAVKALVLWCQLSIAQLGAGSRGISPNKVRYSYKCCMDLLCAYRLPKWDVAPMTVVTRHIDMRIEANPRTSPKRADEGRE